MIMEAATVIVRADSDLEPEDDNDDNVDAEYWSAATMAWFDAVKKEIDDAVQLTGRDRTAKFNEMMPQKYCKSYKNPYQISHKPSTWYSNSRRIQKTQQHLQNAFITLVACLSLGVPSRQEQ